VTDRTATVRFSDRADAYSLHRPGYPPETFDVLFEGLGDSAQLAVADIGAGTGISTALLAQRVARVEAIEPNSAMRERAVPMANVGWRDGTAEQTGLAENSVDVAAAFQAFHWFDAQAAFAEFSRIARRRIALVQYERDETQAFSRAYAAIVRRYATDDTEALRMRTLERFASFAGDRLRRFALPSSQSLTVQGVLGRAASSSYLPQTGAAADAMREEIREMFSTFERGAYVEMAMTVHVLTADV
jgi:ubiquinone/menaquinone biosynthesis C-methylase UbiE